MWQIRCCSNCGNEIFAQANEVDVFCDKCEELKTLRIKVERYEEALNRIVFDETVTYEQTEVIAKRALRLPPFN